MKTKRACKLAFCLFEFKKMKKLEICFRYLLELFAKLAKFRIIYT